MDLANGVNSVVRYENSGDTKKFDQRHDKMSRNVIETFCNGSLWNILFFSEYA